MSEPAANDDVIEHANALFWNPPSLEELMADVAPLDPGEHFDIADLTDEEWEAFEVALAEVRYGALKARWGPARLQAVARLTARVRVLPVDADTIETVAELRNQCRLIGHGLHQRTHNADLWITATAVRWGIPLIAHDAVFRGCPRLELCTELAG